MQDSYHVISKGSMLAGPSKNWLLLSSYKSESQLLGNASCEFVSCCAYSISHTNFLLQVSDPKRYLIDVKPMEVNVLANPPLSHLQKAFQTPVATAQEHIQMGGPNDFHMASILCHSL